MEADMSRDEVLEEIRQLKEEMGMLSKKKVKKANPRLVKNALYYFSDWQRAIDQIM